MKEKLKSVIEEIQDLDIYNLVTKYFNEHEVEETKLNNAIKVYDLLKFILSEESFISYNNRSMYVDVLTAASLFHNLYYEYGEEDWCKLFNLRKMLFNFNRTLDRPVGESWIEAICQAVEGQLGNNSPTALMIPPTSSPSRHLAMACSLVYKYDNN